MTWNDITIRKFQQLKSIPATADEMDKACYTLSILNDKPKSYYESIPIGDLFVEYDEVSFVHQDIPKLSKNQFKVDGKRYIVQANIDGMTAEQFIIINKLTSSTDEAIANLNQLMAVITCRKHLLGKDKWSDNFKQKTEIMLDCPIVVAWNAALFFLKVRNSWLDVTQHYLEIQFPKVMKKITKQK